MRVPFDSVFQSNPDGSISPRVSVSINGITMTPGVFFTGGVSFGGVDIASLRGKDLEVDANNGITMLRGYFQ